MPPESGPSDTICSEQCTRCSMPQSALAPKSPASLSQTPLSVSPTRGYPRKTQGISEYNCLFRTVKRRGRLELHRIASDNQGREH